MIEESSQRKKSHQHPSHVSNKSHEMPVIDRKIYFNDAARKQNLVFAIILLILQIAFCAAYGFIFRAPLQIINITSIITAIALAMLAVPGFGLLFGYTRKLVWSGIGFNFFIFAFCIQFYPLVNYVCARGGFQGNNNPQLSFSGEKIYDLYLANRDVTPSAQLTRYGNCITNAMKCGLALVIAFSSVLGRAGQLQSLLLCIFGTIGFQLNRQLIQERFGADAFGTFYIFTFGGFMGLAMGLMSYCRQKKAQNSINQNSLSKYCGQKNSVIYSMIGALFIGTLFPFLAFDIDAYIYQNVFAPYISTAIVVLSMGAGIIAALIFTLFINGYVVVRDLTHGLVAGAVSVGAGSLYIFTPGYSIITGFVSGFLQTVIQNCCQKGAMRKGYLISSVSWTLFGFQGLIGGIFAAVWKYQAIKNQSNTFSQNVLFNFSEVYEALGMLMSAGLGLVFGIIIGLLIWCTNTLRKGDYFQDGFYWRNNCSIQSIVKQQNNRGSSQKKESRDRGSQQKKDSNDLGSQQKKESHERVPQQKISIQQIASQQKIIKESQFPSSQVVNPPIDTESQSLQLQFQQGDEFQIRNHHAFL